MKGIAESGSIEGSYYTWVDQFDTLGLGRGVPINTGNAAEGLLALRDGEWVTLRVPYPLGVLHQVDGRPHRRPRHRLEGQGHLGDLEHPRAVPLRDRGRHPEQGGQLPAPSRSVGEVVPHFRTTAREDAAERLHPPARRLLHFGTGVNGASGVRMASPGVG